ALLDLGADSAQGLRRVGRGRPRLFAAFPRASRRRRGRAGGTRETAPLQRSRELRSDHPSDGRARRHVTGEGRLAARRLGHEGEAARPSLDTEPPFEALGEHMRSPKTRGVAKEQQKKPCKQRCYGICCAKVAFFA